tara:strand:+ start:1601 stop:3004 length:1404 start_codon:yes stop_codon:yes gene_type:complete
MEEFPIQNLSIKITYKISNKVSNITFKRSLLETSILNTLSLSELPYFTNEVEYPVNSISNMSYDKCVETFFNKQKFYDILLPHYNSDNELNDTIKNKIAHKNIMFMLKVLFPTKFPVVHNLHESLQLIHKQTSTYPLFFNPFKDVHYSYLKINSKTHTISKVTLLNDILNNPFYNELFVQFHKLNKWKEKNKQNFENSLSNYFNANKKKVNTELLDFIKYLDKYKKNKSVNYNLQELLSFNTHYDADKLIQFLNKVYNYFYMSSNLYKLTPSEFDLLRSDYSITNTHNEINIWVDLFDQKITSDNFEDISCKLKEQVLINIMNKPNKKYWSISQDYLLSKDVDETKEKFVSLQKLFNNIVNNDRLLKSKFKKFTINSDSFINYLNKQDDIYSKNLLQIIIYIKNNSNKNIIKLINGLDNELKSKRTEKSLLFHHVLISLKKYYLNNGNMNGGTKKKIIKRHNVTNKK